MALSDDTKNELKGMVATIRERLTNEFTEQLQELYGIQPEGEIADVEDLSLVDEEQRTVAEQLRKSIEHCAGGSDSSQDERQEAIQRTIREQAFTVLNRFAALRLAEERDLVSESVGSGFDSAGFRVYERVAGSSLGETTYDRYRVYLECLFDELALDLGVLFDRYAPEGLLFPREEALEDVLDALNQEDVEDAWTEDETIGWIYQYFHPKSERKGMRDESSTPRNSREMAVRNQLFTPRYVVEFLVDNSLGRYWHEMTEGETDLTDDLDYFVPRENELFLGEDEDPPEDLDEDLYVAPYRDLKDPREIRLLDPACGSMHFGLYAFDLFEQIYAEAWDLYPDLRASLQEDLELEEGDREAFLREVPRLIVEHNLYGIDIDRRAAQIAGLALWLRAQRAWSESDVDSTDRPRIRESGIVCAEPMPGEEDLLEAYVERLEAKGPEGGLLGDLVREIWDRMQIAGEAGPLLKIEREIEDVLEEARRQFQEWKKRKEQGIGRQSAMFDTQEQGRLNFDVADVEESFFEQAESLLLAALQDFAAESTEGTDYGRRLFADDAERGFDFLELMHAGSTTGFDVVVMNPPFGDVSEGAKDYVDDEYPNTKNDVLEAFVERAEELLDHNGFMGAITKRTSLFLSTSGDWRERIVLRKYHPLLLADLGYGVLDAKVETATYVFRSLSEEGQKSLTHGLIPDLENVETTSSGKFSIPKYRRARGFEKKDRHAAEKELKRLDNAGLIREDSGRYTQYRHDRKSIEHAKQETCRRIQSPQTRCYRLVASNNKSKDLEHGDNRLEFSNNPNDFRAFPSTAFVYWTSEAVKEIFSALPALEERGYDARVGLQTADDWRFTRAWWEVPRSSVPGSIDHPTDRNGPYCVVGADWFPFSKGGSFSPYFGETLLHLKWSKHGKEVRCVEGSVIRNPEFYFRRGVTWPRRPYLVGAFSSVQKGQVFGDSGPTMFVGDEVNLSSATAILNSDPFIGLLHLLTARGGVETEQTLKYEVGLVKQIPLPDITPCRGALEKLARQAASAARFEATANIRSHYFQLPAVLQSEGNTLSERIESWQDSIAKHRKTLVEKQEDINEIAFDLYGLGPEDRTGLNMSLYGDEEALKIDEGKSEVRAFQGKIDPDAKDVAEPKDLIHDLVSYLVGAAFGRYDLRYATGEKDLPELPDPTDPLPVCSPGMLTGNDGLPLDQPPSDYPLNVPQDGILVDEEHNPNSLVNRLRNGLEQIFGSEGAARIEQDAVDVLGEDRLEDYLRRPTAFFEAHRKQFTEPKRTSTSRRAPIYWPLQTPSQEYTLWIHYPDLDSQTLYTCVNDYVTPKLENEVRPELQRLREKVQSEETEARDELSRLETLEQELEEMREELLRVAELPYEPNQNDGVELTAAPLRNLFQHTSWSDRLEDYWEELQAGEYDWAHIAYSIWPDRVEDACREDKSIAIAHDREGLYEGDS
ncbi:BREX-1 system adenine-specific DNA-methyltransferase PglX [Salinibacter ruber]|uniref:BREX-1 system adenine-specific DNA-methyltransferase PglX n=1 Tax=Salinibacter ruber TaxID=146919 RepID=UPI00216A23EE|nr:BREX-1 system adenine-specific DNA-methyltransferase PglX [Salinibacter ruber]MCS4201502.1 hypothetical protein [Salinibacter ruber]